MRHLHVTARFLSRLLAVCALLGGSGAAVLLAAGPADATECGTTGSCSVNGSADISGGTLSLTTPSSLAWTDTLNGLIQYVADTNSGDQSYTVDDATGSGDGWNVTFEATQFTYTPESGSPVTLASSGTLSTNGSTSSQSDTTAPTAACSTGATGCTLPTNTLASSYPLALPTDGSTVTTIYNTEAGTGIGSITIGPVGWWVELAPTTLADTYTSTFTLDIVSGPLES